MKYISILILSLSVLILTNSCKHDNFNDYVGPSLCPSPNFKFKNHLSVSTEKTHDTINFLKQPGDTIRASFTEAVSWTVTITGQNSGAKKVYTGHTDTIGIVWFGEPGQFGLPGDYTFFQRNENVNVSLTIPCQETETKTVKIAHESNFAILGSLMTDFDGNGDGISNNTQINGYVNLGDGWSSYVTAPNQITQLAVVNSPLKAPVGPNYLTFQGTAGPTSWYVGGAYATAPDMPATDPNDVYFNCFLSSGNNRSTLVAISLQPGGKSYTKNVMIDWIGWRMISLKVSDFKDTKGNSMPDASKITTLDLGLNTATAQGQSCEVDMDFIIFTKTNPFFH